MSPRAVLFSAAVLCLLQCNAGILVQEFIGYPHSNTSHQVITPDTGNYLILISKTAVPFIFDEIEYTSFQIGWGYVHPLTPSTSGTGVIDLFPYVHNSGCNNIVSNSIFHNEYSQGDPGSATVLDEVSKIVSSSTYFKQVGRCRNNQFMAKWAFEVTWIEVVDQNDDCNTHNTFQLVLTTDGALTFAVMNYALIEQTNIYSDGTVGVSNIAPSGRGLSGAVTVAKSNYHPNSSTPELRNIDDEIGNTGKAGQWVYRTDVITDATVTTEPTTPGDQRGDSKLLLVPRSGTIFGGTLVRIFGPCAQNPKDIKCIFDNKEVDGEYNPDNGQFMCVTPRFQEMGRINFTLQFTTASGEKVVYSSLFSVVLSERYRQVTVQQAELPLLPGSSVKLSWSPDILPFEDPKSYKVDISLFTLDTKSRELKRVKVVATDYPNSGTATITIPQLLLKKGTVITPLIFQVEVARLDSKRKRQVGQVIRTTLKVRVWSTVAYYSLSAIMKFSCDRWAEREPDGQMLLDQVEPCPHTVGQAQLPNSNFVDESIDPCISFIPNVFHSKADICFRQRVPKSGTKAGNQCCYKDGILCTRSECGAGTVDKVSPRDRDTCWEHAEKDVLPAILCCYGAFPDCEKYEQKRPIDDGSKSPPPPPPPACVYGDPHVVTLDGHKYTFNGKGEYTMIATDDDSFTLQGRMVEAINREGEKSAATVYSALVGRITDSDTVQIELRPTGLVTLVNGEQIAFENGTEVLEFQNVFLKDHGNDTISALFASGVYFEVKEENNIISVVIVSLPVVFRGKTSGLMGNFNGDTSDDLTPKGGGEPIPLNSSLEVIHEQFGITWIIDDPDNSLFSYEEDKSWADYFDPNFTPAYKPTFTDPVLEEKAMEICGDDQFCVFDIAATEREEVGMSTMQGNLDLEMITQLSQPVVCSPQCANGTGVCVANNTCSCAPGYLGDTCSEQDNKPCEVNVCQNGGTCTQSVDLVTCDCPEGFAGKQCQTAFTTPRVIPVARTARGYVIRWFISPRVASRVQHFKITVFQLGSNELGDDQITDIPLDSVINHRVRALHITRLTEGYQYHMEVSASVGGVYGPPGAADITF